METMDAILTRRSIRKYLPDPVNRDVIENVLKAGMNAPSAGDEQPWHFVIIDQHDLLEKISEIHPYAKMLKGTPAAVLVCGNQKVPKFKDFWIQDCAQLQVKICCLPPTILGLGRSGLGFIPLKG